jgi:hypothetical protein
MSRRKTKSFVENTKNLLGSFNKDELTYILKLKLKKHGDIASKVADVAHRDTTKRKLMAQGIG